MAILIFLLILSFLVIIHELGHFVTARWMKVKIEEFGIGYPPKMFTMFHWKGIPFTMNWLPFGGFVKMQGEEGDDGGEEISNSQISNPKKSKKLATHDLPTTSTEGPFYTKSKRARLLVLLAGVFLNFVFGILAFAVIYTKVGIPTPSEIPKISIVAESSPAQGAGIQVGDVITAITNTEGETESIETSQEFITYVNEHLGQKIPVEVIRNGEEYFTEVYARTEEERSPTEGAIGIGFEQIELKFYPWWQMPFRGIWVGVQQSIGLSLMIVQAFGDIFVQLFTKARVPEGVAGPVGIVHQASKTGLFQEGWVTILNFAAMLSINLAILNLLPIPALDGGRAMFVLLETIIGPKRREAIEGRLNYFGFGMLLVLIITITLKDVWTLVTDVLF